MVQVPGFSLISLPKLTFPKEHLKCISLLILMGFVVYSNSLLNPFVWDDEALIIKSYLIKNFNNLFKVFTTHIVHNISRSNSYRPLQMVSYMIDYHFWKLNPLGYHITNIFLHSLNGILVYALIFILSKKKIVSLIASIFFVVHPTFVNSVTYISGRADSLACFFIILALIFYIKFSDFSGLKRRILYISSVVCFVLALSSKEIAIVFPLSILLFDFCFRRKHLESTKVFIQNYLPFLIIAIVYACLRLTILNFLSTEMMATGSMPLQVRILVFLKAIFLYLRILIFPVDIHMARATYATLSLFEPLTLLAFLVILLILALLIIFYYKKVPSIFFFGIWFFIFLLPQSGIYPINAAVADHFLYMPSIGFFFILAFLLEKIKPKVIMVLLVFSLIIFFSKYTSNQNEIWNDEERMFKYIIKLSPNSFSAHHNLGYFYLKQGYNDLAVSKIEESLKKDSVSYRTVFAFANLAVLYHRIGKYDKAIEMHKYILEKFPDFNNAETHNLLGINYLVLNKDKEALNEFRQALAIDNNYFYAHFNIGLLYKKQGKLKEAVKELLLSLSNSENMYLWLLSLKQPGIEEYEEIIKVSTKPAEICEKMARLLSEYNLFDVAEAFFKRAIDLGTYSPDLYWNFGSFYYRQGRLKEAKREWKKVLKIDPNHPYAKEWLAKIK